MVCIVFTEAPSLCQVEDEKDGVPAPASTTEMLSKLLHRPKILTKIREGMEVREARRDVEKGSEERRSGRRGLAIGFVGQELLRLILPQMPSVVSSHLRPLPIASIPFPHVYIWPFGRMNRKCQNIGIDSHEGRQHPLGIFHAQIQLPVKPGLESPMEHINAFTTTYPPKSLLPDPFPGIPPISIQGYSQHRPSIM